MNKKKLSTIIVASIISAIVLAISLHKVVYESNHREISITIHYEENRYEEMKLEVGESLLLLKNPVREGYEFQGWYQDSSYEKEYDFSAPITKDTEIYAKMRKI